MRTNDNNEIIMNPTEFQQTLLTVSKQAAKETLREAGLEKKQITKSQANKLYGRGRIERWINKHKITPVKQGGLILLDIATLESLSQTNELFHKLTNNKFNNNRRNAGKRAV